MTKSRTPAPSRKGRSPSSVLLRLDEESKTILTRAAELRRISLSDYVREVTVAQARKEVLAASEHVIALSPEEQLAFWTALNDKPKLTPAQRRLASVMRGKT